MIPQKDIERITDLDIITVLEKYNVVLKQRGANFIGGCPFHNEKTPSFSVSKSKGIYKCFGCGKGGNSVQFVMEHEKLSWIEAIRDIAKKCNIQITEENISEEQKKELQKEAERKESISIVMQKAQEYFENNISNFSDIEKYMLSRIPFKRFWKEVGAGYAPSGNVFKKWARENSLSENICVEADVLAIGNNSVHDSFQNRFIVPVYNSKCQIVGFTGRDTTGERKDKYRNTKEIKGIYEKNKILFGLNFAKESITKKGFSFLVEGNIDCYTLHSVGYKNAVAVGGSDLTDNQIKELQKFTKSVTIIPDNDDTGETNRKKWADKLISSGFVVKILILPKADNIKDVNDFFNVRKLWSRKTKLEEYSFSTYLKQFEQDFILYYAAKCEKLESVQAKGIAVKEISQWLTYMDSAIAEEYISKLGTVWPPRVKFSSKYKELLHSKKEEAKSNPEEDKKKRLPKGISSDDYLKYGFYEKENKYTFDTSKGDVEGSNFVLHPLFHIESVINSKRMFRIINEWGIERIIELKQEDLINLSRFKKAVESLGNFIWKTDDTNLTKLKSYLYEKTDTCSEIEQLGLQDRGFFAWGNGIFDGEFKKVDNVGIVKMGVLGNYYLPAFSDIYKNEPKLFQSERKFIYVETPNTWEDISDKIYKVFGEQSLIGLCFFISTLFSDHIFKRANFFPILNLFGPKGAGKTALANCLMKFFGPMPEGPKITNISLPALAEEVASVSNALVMIDEYKNNLEPDKIEFVKGLWGRRGRAVKNMDKDKKKEMSAVNSGVILCGQEMPTADIALFSRVLFNAFYKTEYSEKERKEYIELVRMLEKGVSHLTCDIIALRDVFENNYNDAYNNVVIEINKRLNGAKIEDRIYFNWVVIIAGYAALKEHISLPVEFNKLLDIATDLMKDQNFETKKGSDVSNFWTIVEYLYREGLLENEIDFRVEEVSILRIGDRVSKFDKPTEILFLDHTKAFMLYRKHGKQTIEQVLPIPTLQYYLQNSKEFLGKKPSIAFKFRDVVTKQIVSDVETPGHLYEEGKKKHRITTAYCFLYSELGINIKYTETSSNAGWMDSIKDSKILDDETNSDSK